MPKPSFHSLARGTSSGVLPHALPLGVKGKQACMQAYVTMHALLTFTQIPQPMQSSSEIQAILAVWDTSIHSLPAQSSLLKKQAQLYFGLTLRAAGRSENTGDFGVPPIFTTGQLFLHSCRHFFGLHLRDDENTRNGAHKRLCLHTALCLHTPVLCRRHNSHASCIMHCQQIAWHHCSRSLSSI